MISRLFVASLAIGLVGGCASAPAGDKAAKEAFDSIEKRLLITNVLRVNFEVEARGAVVADLDGDLVTQQPELAAIRAQGSFAGKPVQPVLIGDGQRLRGGSKDFFDQPAPPDLRDGLLLGLTRMGILHNLAMLSADAAPEGTDGNIEDWVQASSFSTVDRARKIGGESVRGVHFKLEVGGEPAGEVTLWYGIDSGLPVAREQLVNFAERDMRVVERYTIETGGIIGPCRFDADTLGGD